MENKGVFTKSLAIAGSVFAWFPLIMPVVFSLGSVVARGVFRFDYLMPAELFPVALLGGCLLLWGALRARMHQRLIGPALGAAFGLLVLGQVVAVYSGLASGEIEPTGFWWGVVLTSVVLYIFSLVVMGLGGLLLLRDLFKPSRLPVRSF